MQPDPALGISVDFPEEVVRNGLLFAMQMGAPNDASERVKFIMKGSGRQYFLNDVEVFPAPDGDLKIDRDGLPLNPEVEVVNATDQEIEVDVAIEIEEVNADETPVGNFRPVRATVTLMQEEYEQVDGCRELAYNNDRYGYGYEPDSIGLFGMNFHVMIFYALDES